MCVLKVRGGVFFCEKLLFSIIWNLIFGCELFMEGGLGRFEMIIIVMKFVWCCELFAFEYRSFGCVYIKIY